MQKSKKIYCRYLLVLSLLVSLITGICTSAFADSYTYDIRLRMRMSWNARFMHLSLVLNPCQLYLLFIIAMERCM